VIIVTDHSDYDYARIVADARLVVDIRNAIHGISATQTLPVLAGIFFRVGAPRWKNAVASRMLISSILAGRR
jgi:hypothetical protein